MISLLISLMTDSEYPIEVDQTLRCSMCCRVIIAYTTQRMCVWADGPPSPLLSVKSLDPLSDLENQMNVYSDLLNCFLSV